MRKPDGLVGVAELYGPITVGTGKRCDLTPINMASAVSAIRGVVAIPSTYHVHGEIEGMDGLHKMAEAVIGLTREESETAPAAVVFLYGGRVEGALLRMQKNGVLVVVGTREGHPMREEWMRVRPLGVPILQRYQSVVTGPDKSGDIGIGIIHHIRTELILPNHVPLPNGQKKDGRRGGRLHHLASSLISKVGA